MIRGCIPRFDVDGSIMKSTAMLEREVESGKVRPDAGVRPRVVHLQNIFAFYRAPLWENLAGAKEFDFELIVMAATEKKRAAKSWQNRFDELACCKTMLNEGVLEERSALRYAFEVWRVLNQRKPDVVIVGDYTYLADWAALLWCRLHNVPSICHYGSVYLAHGRRRAWYTERVKRLFFSHVTSVAAYSRRAKEYAVWNGMAPGRVHVIGNAVPTVHLADEVGALRDGCVNSQKDILYVGRLSKEKNLLRLADAFVRAREDSRNPDSRLVLVGDGPLRPQLEKYADAHTDAIEVAGYKQRHELAPFFARARALVLPSTEEPWGLVVNEAMACGLPVLVSDYCGCVDDLVRDGVNGFRFDPFDVEEMSYALRRVMDPEIDVDTLGASGARLVAGYSMEKASARLIRQIQGLLKNSPAS